jgi:hypothetical protein
VDTIGAGYAAGQRIHSPRLGFNGVLHLREPAVIPLRRASRPSRAGEGVGGFRAALLFNRVTAVTAFRGRVFKLRSAPMSSHKARNFAPRNPTRRGAFCLAPMTGFADCLIR